MSYNFSDLSLRIQSFFFGVDPGITSILIKLFYTPKLGSIEEAILSRAKNIESFKFLQIGGNDGFVRDPIFKFVKSRDWRGIIVEPQTKVFNKRLKRTYRFESKVILENYAISHSSSVKPLYKIAFSEARWATGLASFNKATLDAHIEKGYVQEKAIEEGVAIPDHIEDYISTEDVKCITIVDLLIKHGFESIDLLQIDTEGFDYEIIKTIDFATLKPSIISFESEHLSTEEKIECDNYLASHGYSVKHIKRDSIAFYEEKI